MEAGAVVVDARPVAAFAAGHVPGAISIALRPVFASWLGWLVAPDDELLFVLDDGQDRAELVRQCLTIGFERLVGEVDGGMDAWRNVAVMCGHGERAATAASVLRRRRARDVAVMLGGPDDRARRHQRALATHP